MNVELQKRIAKYAIQHLRGEIRKAQQQIIELEQTLAAFPNSAISDFAVRLGSFKSLKDENHLVHQLVIDLRQRLAQMQADYDELISRWIEMKDLETIEAVRAIWERSA